MDSLGPRVTRGKQNVRSAVSYFLSLVSIKPTNANLNIDSPFSSWSHLFLEIKKKLESCIPQYFFIFSFFFKFT